MSRNIPIKSQSSASSLNVGTPPTGNLLSKAKVGGLGERTIAQIIKTQPVSEALEGLTVPALVSKMRDERSGIVVKNRRWRLKTYKECFVAQEAVDWLMKELPLTSRNQAVEICQYLLDQKMIHHVTYDHMLFEDKLLFFRWQKLHSEAEISTSFENSLLNNMRSECFSNSPESASSSSLPADPSIAATDSAETSRQLSDRANSNADEMPLAELIDDDDEPFFYEVICGLLDPQFGVEVADRRYHLKVYKQCFIGSEAVDWLVRTLGVQRNVALQIGASLMQRGYIRHVANSEPFADEYFFYEATEYTNKLLGAARQSAADDMSPLSTSEQPEKLRVLPRTNPQYYAPPSPHAPSPAMLLSEGFVLFRCHGNTIPGASESAQPIIGFDLWDLADNSEQPLRPHNAALSLSTSGRATEVTAWHVAYPWLVWLDAAWVMTLRNIPSNYRTDVPLGPVIAGELVQDGRVVEIPTASFATLCILFDGTHLVLVSNDTFLVWKVNVGPALNGPLLLQFAPAVPKVVRNPQLSMSTLNPRHCRMQYPRLLLANNNALKVVNLSTLKVEFTTEDRLSCFPFSQVKWVSVDTGDTVVTLTHERITIYRCTKESGWHNVADIDVSNKDSITHLHVDMDAGLLLTGDRIGRISLCHLSSGKFLYDINDVQPMANSDPNGSGAGLSILDPRYYAERVNALAVVGRWVVAGVESARIALYDVNRPRQTTTRKELQLPASYAVRQMEVDGGIIFALCAKKNQSGEAQSGGAPTTEVVAFSPGLPHFYLRRHDLVSAVGTHRSRNTLELSTQEAANNFKLFSSPVEWFRQETLLHKFTVLVFYKSTTNTFDREYLKKWQQIYYIITKLGGELFAITSQTQKAADKDKVKLKLSYTLLSDERCTLARFFGMRVSDPTAGTGRRGSHRYAITTGGVYIGASTGECLFEWFAVPTLSNLGGGRDRPDPDDVMLVVVKRLNGLQLTAVEESELVAYGDPSTAAGWRKRSSVEREKALLQMDRNS